MAGVIALKKYLQNGFIIVANGYSKEIKVKVTSQLGERIIQNFKIEFGPTKIGIEVEKEIALNCEKLGFSKIKPGDFLKFHVSADGIFGSTVYVSIMSEARTIADNFPIREGTNVIVDGDGYVKNTKLGETWIDTNDKCHQIALH